jgi:hypothetical protein
MQHRESPDAIAGALGGSLFAFCGWLAILAAYPIERFFPLDVIVLVTAGAIVGSTPCILKPLRYQGRRRSSIAVPIDLRESYRRNHGRGHLA